MSLVTNAYTFSQRDVLIILQEFCYNELKINPNIEQIDNGVKPA